MKQNALTSATARSDFNRIDFTRPPRTVRRQKILVADDNPDVRRVMADALRLAGFDTQGVDDGEAAWHELQHHAYNLLVTDLDMPRLAGLPLIQRLRDAGMSLPVIMVSGHPETVSVQDHVKLQIAAVLPKPFNLLEFQDTVKFTLLATKASAASRVQPASQPLPRFVPSIINSHPLHNHVLIADDDDVVRGSLAAVLQSEGYEVDEASDGIEAVSCALKHKPDLVLLDLNMPHADGWTAFNQLDQVTPLLPVIIITARPNQYPEAVRVGVDAFMEKPLNIPVLVKAVKRLTNEDEGRHVNRITQRTFVTQLLGSAA
jgi:DNA-binding response OmpR family regulator